VILATGDVYAQIPQRQAVIEAMARAQQAAREEPGCELFAFAEAIDDPGHFLLLQRWHDRTALDAHYASAGFAEYQAAIAPLLVRDSELHVHVVQESTRPLNSARLDLHQDD
jgi:quinol monooxygenase YgiN